MDPSSESLLRGEKAESKPFNEDNPTEVSSCIAGKRPKKRYSLLKMISCVSLILNLILTAALLHLCAQYNRHGRSKYAGLARDVSVEWNPYSMYGTGNEDETNRSILWESLDASPGAVSLDNQWAKDHGLPQAQPFPWDKRRGLYLLNGHHSLHCMRKIRRWVTIAYHNGTQLDGYAHLVHCMDHLLQNILCDADDTPLYTTQTPNKDAGLHQTRRCRSWDALNRWAATQPGCFVFLNETQGVGSSSFARFTWCPRGSPYAARMAERMGLPEGWYEERPAEIDSMPPYWLNFTHNRFIFHEETEI